jgi:hypothetical protein
MFYVVRGLKPQVRLFSRRSEGGEGRMKSQNVINIEELRDQKHTKDRRAFERVLLSNIRYAFLVIPERGLLKVGNVDISESGVGFTLPKGWGRFRKQERLAFRLYFSPDDYIPLTVKVVRSVEEKEAEAEGTQSFYRYGCEIEASEPVKACLSKLVSFVKSYVQVARQDRGDRRIL